VGEGVERGGGGGGGGGGDEGQVVMTNISLPCHQHFWPGQLHSLTTEVFRHLPRKKFVKRVKDFLSRLYLSV
jgi:hypothetical protein